MNADKVKLGIAPINWTNDDLPLLGGNITFEQCISEMALAGYQGCEVGNKFPKDPEVLREYLDIRGLQVCNQWFSYQLSTKSFQQNRKEFLKLLDFLQALDARIIGGGETANSCHGFMDVPILQGKGHLQTSRQWKKFTRGLDELGKIARDRGFRLAFHHHMGTVIQSMEETDRLLDSTAPENVWLNYDCGHFTFAGEDPVAALQKYLPRIAHIHLKDLRPAVLEQVRINQMSFLQAVMSGIFTVPGDEEGCIDFEKIFRILKQSDYQGWIVVEAEQDPAKANPFAYALKARNFIRKHLNL